MGKPDVPGRLRLSLAAATWFGAGRLPYMPGTWGSLAALPLWWPLQFLPGMVFWGVVVGLSAAALHACEAAEIALGRQDAPEIVLDEVVGQVLTLGFADGSLGQVVMGVILFRGFDILKPFPAGWINGQLTGGVGILLDDVVAGLYAGLTLAVLSRCLPL